MLSIRGERFLTVSLLMVRSTIQLLIQLRTSALGVIPEYPWFATPLMRLANVQAPLGFPLPKVPIQGLKVLAGSLTTLRSVMNNDFSLSIVGGGGGGPYPA